ncbi:MAG: hypothetical protein IIX01_00030 [Clostridia bacterium]|nr:hypothetical protein [Clostridia bacterium]
MKKWESGEKSKFRLKNERIKDVVLLSVLALALCFAVWKIFLTKSDRSQTVSAKKTEQEIALEELLSQIDGAGEVRVMIGIDEEEITSVVIVCDGAKNIRVNTELREAAATALGTQEKNVKIYLKKD